MVRRLQVFRLVLPVALALALLVGLALGAFGGGGGTLLLPVLLYVLSMGMHEAVPSSLVVIGLTSLLALIPPARSGHVNWRIGALFGLASVVTAFTAGRLAHLIPGWTLSLGFALVLVTTAIATRVRGRSDGLAEASSVGGVATTEPDQDRALASSHAPTRNHPIYVALAGGVVGVLTGLLGVGGGFLAVPALIMFAGLELPVAIGTSLLVIVLNSAAAAMGHAASHPLDIPLLMMLSVAAIVGSLAGQALTRRLETDTLQSIFADFVAAMAIFMLVQELGRLLLAATALRSYLRDMPTWSATELALLAAGLGIAGFVALRVHERWASARRVTPRRALPRRSTPPSLSADRAVVRV